MRCFCGCGKEAGYKVSNGRPDLSNPKRFYNNRHFNQWQKAILRKDAVDALHLSAEMYEELPLFNPALRKTMFEMARKGNRMVIEKLKEMGFTGIYINGALVRI